MSGALPNLSISGATGDRAVDINGIWDRSGEVVAGLPVYFKRGDANWCLEYYAPNCCLNFSFVNHIYIFRLLQYCYH